MFIYIATTLPPQQTYRTHSPKLRLILVLKNEEDSREGSQSRGALVLSYRSHGEAGRGVGIWLSLLAQGRAFDWSCSPREGVFVRRGDICLPTRTKKTETEQVIPASTLHACAVYGPEIKDLEIMVANENKRKLTGIHCFVFKFLLF